MQHLRVTAASDRVNEAKHFLSEMARHADNWDLFRYNFNAFLQSARSATWILKKTYAHFDGFKDWYGPKENEMRENGLMAYFVELRNQLSKERVVSSSFPVSVYTEGEGNKALHIYFITGTGSTISIPVRLEVATQLQESGCIYFFEDNNKKDVLSLCRDYACEVEKVVKEWESRFHRNDYGA